MGGNRTRILRDVGPGFMHDFYQRFSRFTRCARLVECLTANKVSNVAIPAVEELEEVETTEYQDFDSLTCRTGIASYGSNAADLPHYSFAPRFCSLAQDPRGQRRFVYTIPVKHHDNWVECRPGPHGVGSSTLK
jgi:hypothetical protein